MSSGRKNSVRGQTKDDVPVLKMRIAELEEQVTELKKRIDELRKAKNTTTIKREREIIDVKAPNLGKRESTLSEANRDKLLNDLKEKHAKELNDLAMRHRKEIEALRKDQNAICDHEPEIMLLRQNLSDAETDVMLLRIENEELHERVEGLMLELSIKEAKWCENEDALKLKLSQEWQEKYRQWMEGTERKLAELQEANNLMRGYLKKQKPGGPDPNDRGEGST